jgi:nitroimidazol reductase NimA-like FMN-containing flavoprotein (pyridoxamine 5'-phosphate oxidase superfamily)
MTVEALEAFGLEEMSDDQIRDFLTNEGYGVLGLPTTDIPYMIPLSFGYEGEGTLYFTFFVGEGSRKRDLAESTDRARFLVYSAISPFFWESVMLTGTLSAAEWADHQAAMDNAWHLDVFERAREVGTLQVFAFEIDQQRGLKYPGLPEGYADPTDESPS